jgi:hypothetical protein
MVGLSVSATSVRELLREAGLGPAGDGGRKFIRRQAASMLACDFFTVDTVFSVRLYVLFFIELGSRRVHLAGCTQRPSGAWVAQQARQLARSLAERASPPRLLIHDRDSKFNAQCSADRGSSWSSSPRRKRCNSAIAFANPTGPRPRLLARSRRAQALIVLGT